MLRHSAPPQARAGRPAVVVACSLLLLACSHDLQERCDLIAQPWQTPALPGEFAPLDRALVERIASMNHDARALRGSLARSFQISWASQVNAQAPQLKTAKLIWDYATLVVATYDAAMAAADIAAASSPPSAPLPSVVQVGGTAAVATNAAAYAELAEALRRLIAAGALDGTVVAALSTTLSGQSGSAPFPNPVASLMSSSAPDLQHISIRRDVPPLSGGRSGERVKDLVGPPNSAVRGAGGDRAFITDTEGRVIRDVTRDRVKDVTPGVGFGPKRMPTSDELRILELLLEDDP